MRPVHMPISEALGGGVVPDNLACSPGERRDRLRSGLDAVDEMVEINGGQLRLRPHRTDWHTVASKDTADPGKPIRFTTVEVVGYLTFTELSVVLVVAEQATANNHVCRTVQVRPRRPIRWRAAPEQADDPSLAPHSPPLTERRRSFRTVTSGSTGQMHPGQDGWLYIGPKPAMPVEPCGTDLAACFWSIPAGSQAASPRTAPAAGRSRVVHWWRMGGPMLLANPNITGGSLAARGRHAGRRSP
jgi:hypothetical protein